MPVAKKPTANRIITGVKMFCNWSVIDWKCFLISSPRIRGGITVANVMNKSVNGIVTSYPVRNSCPMVYTQSGVVPATIQWITWEPWKMNSCQTKRTLGNCACFFGRSFKMNSFEKFYTPYAISVSNVNQLLVLLKCWLCKSGRQI